MITFSKAYNGSWKDINYCILCLEILYQWLYMIHIYSIIMVVWVFLHFLLHLYLIAQKV
jgi:hypothetical protein